MLPLADWSIARDCGLTLALWSFLMKKTITTACTTIAVTITTPNTPPRAATDADESPLLMSDVDVGRE